MVTLHGAADVRVGTNPAVRVFHGQRLIWDRNYRLTRYSNPARTEVTSPSGVWLATLTDGARTATLAGMSRTFTELKPPILDTFARTISNGWGPSPNAATWGHFGGNDADYSVSSGLGRIAVGTANVSRYTRLDDNIATFDARMRLTLSTTPTGAANSVALIGGWQSTSNHWRFRLTFGTSGAVTAAITRLVDGTETNISGNTTVASSGFTGGAEWWVRGSFDGTTLRMWAWPATGAEPTPVTTSVADTTFPTGRLGLRAFTSSGATNAPELRVSQYGGTAAWPSPPTITHSTRVRLLPAAFTGNVSRTWLAAALADTSPDLLTVATQYVTGATALVDGNGVQYAGDADYGPLNAAGGRDEGADFNDYLGLPWTYTGTDQPEAPEFRCLDCSGFIRMVFGYRSGLPLSLTATGSGQLPRASRDQLDAGPGVLIVPRTGVQATDLSRLRVGDVVGFDATNDLTEFDGELDHIGIYMGIDASGVPRFISARKSPSGPTFADLGGPSTLTGNGLYARKLRLIRRF